MAVTESATFFLDPDTLSGFILRSDTANTYKRGEKCNEQESIEMRPIGLVYEEDGKIVAEINGNLRRGLKYISLFSHIILLYRSDTQPNILYTNLSQITVALEAVHEKEGKLLSWKQSVPWKPDGLGSGRKLLYDIKPYFPNEDRIPNALSPAHALCVNPAFYKDTLTRLGTIRKEQGNFFLEIPEDFGTWCSMLQGYSHIRILWWFHKFEKECFRNTLECDPPYENAPRTGVFASRSPVRPNPLALTAARIIKIDRKQAVYRFLLWTVMTGLLCWG